MIPATSPLVFSRLTLVYVSGAYTSKDPAQVAENKALADEIGVAIRALGAEPLVPHRAVVPIHYHDPEKVWKIAMRSCLTYLLRCDAVVMVPNWRTSRGARVERYLATRWGLAVFDNVTDFALTMGNRSSR